MHGIESKVVVNDQRWQERVDIAAGHFGRGLDLAELPPQFLHPPAQFRQVGQHPRRDPGTYALDLCVREPVCDVVPNVPALEIFLRVDNDDAGQEDRVRRHVDGRHDDWHLQEVVSPLICRRTTTGHPRTTCRDREHHLLYVRHP